MLGLIHRTVLGLSPPQFGNWFFLTDAADPVHRIRRQERLHNKQLHDWLSNRDTELLRRSALGLVRVYNELPRFTVEQKTVKDFQTSLQNGGKDAVAKGVENWQNGLNLRKRRYRQGKH